MDPAVNPLRALVRAHGLVRTTQIDPFNDFVLRRFGDLRLRAVPFELVEEVDLVPIARTTVRLVRIAVVVDASSSSTSSSSPFPTYPEHVCGWSSHGDYAVPVHADVEVVTSVSGDDHAQTQTQLLRDVHLFDLPVMVGSVLCSTVTHPRPHLDAIEPNLGGYFIVGGQERAVICHEQACCNRLLRMHNDATGEWTMHVRSRDPTTAVSAVLDISFEGGLAVATLGARASGQALLHKVPALVLLRAVVGANVTTTTLTTSPWLAASRDAANGVLDNKNNNNNNDDDAQQAALAWLGERMSPDHGHGRSPAQRATDALETLRVRLLPHEPEWRARGEFLKYMLEELVACLEGERAPDDRDHLQFRRVDTVGRLMFALCSDVVAAKFRDVHRALQFTVKRKGMRGALDRLDAELRRDSATRALRMHIATGNWKPFGSLAQRAGITQRVQRENWMVGVSQMRKIIRHLDANNRDERLRGVEPTSRGYVCPVETPEGSTVGLQMYLAAGARVSSASRPWDVATAIARQAPPGPHRMFVDGRLLTKRVDGPAMQRAFARARRAGNAPVDASASFTKGELHVCGDEGRLMRALVVVPPWWGGGGGDDDDTLARLHDPTTTFDQLLASGMVEWLDAGEEWSSTHVVASTPYDVVPGTTTHMELHPCAMLGVTANLMPFANYDPGPRATYTTAMAKAAVGRASLVHRRLDPASYELWYPQRPLARTWMEEEMHAMGRTPAGQEAVLAICIQTGYNQEDSLEVCAAADDLGFQRFSVVHVETSGPLTLAAATDAAEGDVLGFIHEKEKAYSHADGTIHVGERVGDADGEPTILIHKRTRVKSSTTTNGGGGGGGNAATGGTSSYIERRTPIRLHHRGEAVVRAVMRRENEIAVEMVATRRPSVGQKLMNHNAQKGVVGRLVRPEDMMFFDCVSDPRLPPRPDIVLNTHGIPSRMTVGLFFEGITSMLAATIGRPHDATAFSEMTATPETLEKELLARGFTPAQRAMDGTTGEIIDGAVFVGPIYYSALKHVAIDKLHARARGPIHPVTRQPNEGRARDGGFRVGEMERDCMIAYGASAFLKERTLDSSDGFPVTLCTSCGDVLDVAPSSAPCRACGTTTEGTPSRVRYPFLLLRNELKAMGISLSLSSVSPVSVTS